MLAPHPFAALEYWFFKVNAGPTALIVDWILRRRANELWLRASLHAPGRREVLFEQCPLPVGIDPSGLSQRHTTGQVQDVGWELDVEDGAEPITLRATGRDYGDFGEGILNTLVGDLEVYEGDRLIATALGTAGLERRA